MIPSPIFSPVRIRARSKARGWPAGRSIFIRAIDGDVASRSLVGDLVFRYKYNGEQQLAQDLAQRWADLLAAHPELPQFDAVIPVPPSLQRASDPVTMLAQALPRN